MTGTTSRRARLREATLSDIRETARRLLVSQGAGAVTINGVAREIGMSGPALYRYYASRQELVDAVTSDFFRELASAIEAARRAHDGSPTGRRVLAMCRALRRWAIDHPAEFGWVFASPLAAGDRGSTRYRAGHEFGELFAEQVAALWEERPFPVPRPDELPASLWNQLRDYETELDGRLPTAALYVFLTCWIRLYGLLCMEVLHQLDFAFTDPEPVYEQCLRELCAMFGIDYEPPA
ncbi:TetR/AcrR family transcriptional regulator [Pseudonocardia acaciae]|uniref:TetR/AcrR family transcriptional regulator n=1 Tax=Pseudonocardia acaciae TaxID=551276 RepID=UPI00048F62D5|nr:TetR/AcrR family transcriptional regulator [Pseudonocardia acaciae]